MKRQQIRFSGIEGYRIILKIPDSLYEKLMIFCHNRKQCLNDVLCKAFEGGIVSEEAIESYIENNS